MSLRRSRFTKRLVDSRSHSCLGRSPEALLKVRARSEQAASLVSIVHSSHMCRARFSHMLAASRRRQRWPGKEKVLPVHPRRGDHFGAFCVGQRRKYGVRLVYSSGQRLWYAKRASDQYTLHTLRVFMRIQMMFAERRACVQSRSCVTSKLGYTTVLINSKRMLQHSSSGRKLRLCQGAPCDSCLDALHTGALPGACLQAAAAAL